MVTGSSASASLDQGMGFLRALFDFRFVSFISTKMIRFVYGIVMAVAAIFWLGAIAATFRLNSVVGVAFLVVIAPLGFLVTLTMWRLVLEFLMVQFRIAEYLRLMANRDSSQS